MKREPSANEMTDLSDDALGQATGGWSGPWILYVRAQREAEDAERIDPPPHKHPPLPTHAPILE